MRYGRRATDTLCSLAKADSLSEFEALLAGVGSPIPAHASVVGGIVPSTGGRRITHFFVGGAGAGHLVRLGDIMLYAGVLRIGPRQGRLRRIGWRGNELLRHGDISNHLIHSPLTASGEGHDPEAPSIFQGGA
jgi:hypothetical protein